MIFLKACRKGGIEGNYLNVINNHFYMRISIVLMFISIMAFSIIISIMALNAFPLKEWERQQVLPQHVALFWGF